MPFPGAAVLCSAIVLLLPLLAIIPTTAALALNTTTTPCAPAPCGGLNISYPFWLAGTHPRECGYKAFQLSCKKGEVSLVKKYWASYKILDIFYENSSFRVANVNLSEDTCNKYVVRNVSIDYVSLSPFVISPKNEGLFFLYDCQAQVLLQDWAPVSCTTNRNHSANNSFAWLSGWYMPGATLTQPPGNCSRLVIPVLASEGETGADYQRLLEGGFLLQYWAQDCEACKQTGGRCRINNSSDVFECHCSDGVYPKFCGKLINGSKRTRRKIIIIALTAAAAGSFLLTSIYLLIWHPKGRKLRLFLYKKTSSSSSNERNIEALISSHGSIAPKRYKYRELTKITSSFKSKLGEGGYGMVFKGMLHDGRLVAVKLLHDSKANGEEFVNEVMSIGRTSHVNIVSLFGFCLEGSKRALIYEYMPNGSLDKYIYSDNPKSILGWERLYALAVGIARGLEYLHHSCNTRIVHFDIKPQNILLDHDFCPKIADFGLAKLCRTKESRLSMTGARGTIGFIAPEVHSRTFGVVSTKSDVYSYGMMLLEMVGGRKNVKSVVEKSSQKYFPEWIYDHFTQQDGLQACEVTGEVEEISKKIILIGLWCVQILPMHRPTITKVLEMFERGSEELDMPPKQNFSQILEDSAYNLSSDDRSSNHSQTQDYGEMVRNKETSQANSRILQRLPTL